ncbi:MAG: HyaD/HybD family hydrogenase maturation endopeptidase [Gammaproteobacteria bacterium]|nr:HyaD/HybD family hydrogenase maturation endopeptidase [Gammaproteobacteria bacterium]MDH5800685.1 HyaD/HybD family hydrogenase maturation endopeptidase [Gammaproteobacteria bacterium]
MSTLVLGIGNTLLADEGVGVHAVRYLESLPTCPKHIHCVDGGTLSFTLAEAVATHEQLIVLDAAQLQQQPGNHKTFIGEEIDRFLNQCSHRSVHDLSLLDMFDVLRLTNRMPEKRALVGIQPAVIDWSEKLSGVLQEALPAAVNSVIKLVKYWQQ